MVGNYQLAMRVFLSFLVLSLFGCSSNQPKNADEGARQATERWLQALDASDEEVLWLHTSQVTKNKEEKAELLKRWVGGRQNYGKLIKRDLQLNFEIAPYQFQGNIPDGIYRRIVYWTKYERRDLAKEEVLLSFENGEWTILQYRVL